MGRIKRDRRQRVWPSVLDTMAPKKKNPPPAMTAAALSDLTGLEYGAALAVLRRLRGWGYVRLVGFGISDSGVGRRPHLFEITDAGLRALGYQKRKKRRK